MGDKLEIKQAIVNVGSNVPAVVLTYIGDGSPYYAKFEYIAKLGDQNLAAPLLASSPPPATQAAVSKEEIADVPDDEDQQLVPLPTDQVESGWIFLGKYIGDGQWENARSDDIAGKTPGKLEGENIVLSTGVNLRSSAFEIIWAGNQSCTYRETSIVGGLASGTTVNLKNVLRLRGCSRYVWAEVEAQ